MKRVNLDLKKLLGFKIVSNEVTSSKTLKISSKLGDKIGGPKPSTPKLKARNS
jgi:hypothetical protein